MCNKCGVCVAIATAFELNRWRIERKRDHPTRMEPRLKRKHRERRRRRKKTRVRDWNGFSYRQSLIMHCNPIPKSKIQIELTRAFAKNVRVIYVCRNCINGFVCDCIHIHLDVYTNIRRSSTHTRACGASALCVGFVIAKTSFARVCLTASHLCCNLYANRTVLYHFCH